MTAHDILLETIRLRKEDATDTTLMTEYNAVALVGMNKGYRDICSKHINPIIWDDVALDANKRFDLSVLSNTVQQIIDVCKYEDYTADSNWLKADRYDWTLTDNDTIVVPAADAGGTVHVQYEAVPADLVNPNPTTGSGATSPSLIPAQYHRALAMSALSMLYATEGLKDNAMFWDAEYQSFLESMRPVQKQTAIEPYYSN